MAQNTMPMSNNPEKNKLELDLKLKDGDDIPFILCTPILNENDDAAQAQAQDTTTDADEADSPKLKTFFINPRRSSCQCPRCRDKKVVGPTANAEMLSESSLIGMGKGSASANESLDCNTLHSSPRSSPVPILQSPFDVMVTPRVINLLKNQRASQEEEQHKEEEDDDEKSASTLTAGPLFPILGRQYNHLLQQQQHPVIRRPIPRYRR